MLPCGIPLSDYGHFASCLDNSPLSVSHCTWTFRPLIGRFTTWSFRSLHHLHGRFTPWTVGRLDDPPTFPCLSVTRLTRQLKLGSHDFHTKTVSYL